MLTDFGEIILEISRCDAPTQFLVAQWRAGNGTHRENDGFD